MKKAAPFLTLIALLLHLAFFAGLGYWLLDTVPDITRSYPWMGGVAISGLATILLALWQARTASQPEVIYVEKNRHAQQQSAEEAGVITDAHAPTDRAAALLAGLDRTAAWPEPLLRALCRAVDAVQGAYYLLGADGAYHLAATYAWIRTDGHAPAYAPGEGLVGQVARERGFLHIRQVPPGYLTILTGLGQTDPAALLLSSIVGDDPHARGVLELAAFRPFSEADQALVRAVAEHAGQLPLPEMGTLATQNAY